MSEQLFKKGDRVVMTSEGRQWYQRRKVFSGTVTGLTRDRTHVKVCLDGSKSDGGCQYPFSWWRLQDDAARGCTRVAQPGEPS